MEISPARGGILCRKSLRLLTSSSSSMAPVLFLSLFSPREYRAGGHRMANLTVLLVLLLFCESEYWDTFAGFLKSYFFLRSLFPCPLPPNVISTLTHCILPCVLMQKQSPGRRQKEAVRSRGAAERPNTPACEASETEEFRGWIIKFNF